MKSKGFLCLLAVLVILTSFFAQGCASENVDKPALNNVNEYIKELGFTEKIDMDAATAMDHSIYQNKDTDETKSDWQFVVEFVENQQSDHPINLDYDVAFSEGSLSLDLNKDWENIAK